MIYRMAALIILSMILIPRSIFSMDYKINAYADAYYASQTTDPLKIDKETDSSSFRRYGPRKFSTVNAYNNDFSINIAQITASAESEMFHSLVTIQFGDIPDIAWKNTTAYSAIQQAYAGFRIIPGLWIDAGFFLTHIGGESLLPKDNWLSSHSMLTYYEPFFQAGMRLVYKPNDKITAMLHLLNGSGIFEENNDNKTLGVNLAYETKKWTISYAGVYGNEDPGGLYKNGFNNFHMHMYHNVNFYFKLLELFEAKAQFDYATREGVDKKSDPDVLLGFGLQGRVRLAEKWYAAARFTWHDNSGYTTGDGIGGTGLTFNGEYRPVADTYIRLEGRYLTFKPGTAADGFPGRLFTDGSEMINNRFDVAVNFGASFDILSAK